MDIEYTTAELEEFKRLYMATGSYDNAQRVIARIDLREFLEKHGKDKCNAMYEKLMAEGVPQ